MTRINFDGKVALVTGGASGIGWATAQMLCDHGARVMIADRDGDRARQRAAELGTGHSAVAADVSSKTDVAAMLDACVMHFGRLDVLVNNAGRTDSRGLPLNEHDASSFEAVMSVNLEGTMQATRIAAELMRERGGAIVNVASGAAFRAIPMRGSYSASKAGVVGFTKSFAAQRLPVNVRVNAVAPGFVRTELVDGLVAEGRLDLAEAAAKIPLGRVGEPAEIAAAICYLASPAATDVRGAVLSVDGASSAFGASRLAPAARIPRAASESGVIAVLGDETAQACIDLIRADGHSTCHVPSGLADDPGLLTERLAALASRYGCVSGFIDASDLPSGLAIGQQLTRQFLSATAVGRVLCQQGWGAYAALARRAASFDPVDGDVGCETIAMLVKTMACEWAPFGVRANAVIAGGNAGSAGLLAFLVSHRASFVAGSIVDISGRA
ncbi:glucose 1-dehydrogenase [Mesorhizobium sp. CAU 1741]|uniref:SDR family NAD(P)-dependent oxidoreductase n=1 Tax=Mesorhizobium sp. CAU 1741 TaxID=3140366 RepID=UPI00325AF8CE